MPSTSSGEGHSLEARNELIWPGNSETHNDARVILMQQMDVVANYLAQARAANRSPEEIANLAQNLADLEAEITRLSDAAAATTS